MDSDTSVMFDTVKEAFNYIAAFIEVFINRTSLFGIGPEGNDNFCSSLCNHVSKPVTVITFVNYYCSCYIICQQDLCLPVVGLLANRKYQPTEIASALQQA